MTIRIAEIDTDSDGSGRTFAVHVVNRRGWHTPLIFGYRPLDD